VKDVKTVKREMRPVPNGRKGGARQVRAAAMGLTVVGMGLLALALWSAADRAEAATTAAGKGTVFSSYIDDLPVMPGLAEDDQGYAFDLYQGGRLAEARLGGDAEAAVVRGFYAATLAQLGWRASETEPYVYHRGRERLIFLVEPRRQRKGQKAAKGLEAVFVITPDTRGPAPVGMR
jgi:hypothetical protein